MSSYASPSDLTRYGINANALKGISTQDQQTALDAAATRLDGYLTSFCTLPIVTWGDDIRRHCAIVAAFDLMMGRGLDPDDEMSKTLRERFDAEQDWLNRIARREVKPTVTDSGAIASQDKAGSGAFALQTQVVSGFVATGVNTTGAPPNIQENSSGGNVITGPANLRGW